MLKLDLSFDALTALFAKHGVKLTRGGLTLSFPNSCVVAAIAVINGTTYGGIHRLLDDDTLRKLESIEVGFEGWEMDDECIESYYEIGKKLYEASLNGGIAG